MRRFRLSTWSGLAILAAAALWLNTPHLAPGMANWAEPGNVAAALAGGRGFSDPFGGGTGPTAWVPPLPVWVEAAAFRVFGAKTAGASEALLVLAVLGLAGANAFLAGAMRPLGVRAQAAACGAFLGYCVLLPGGPLRILSEAWIDILLSCALLWAAVGIRSGRGRAAEGVLVASTAAAILDNVGLAVAAGLVCATLAWLGRGDRRLLAAPLAALAAAALAVGGWTLRNTLVLGRVVPVKSNLWFEVNLANVDAPDGLPRTEAVLRRMPFFSQAEFDRYRALGELAYVDGFRGPSLRAIGAAPAHFAANVLRRAGLAAVFCRRESGAAFSRRGPGGQDAARLALAGEWLQAGPMGGYWTRIDQDPIRERALIASLGLAEPGAAWADWSRCRLDYDDEFRSALAIAVGFAMAGLPTLALLAGALLGGGAPRVPARWAAVIAAGMLVPYVIINHNERHQIPLAGMQAAILGCLAAPASRRGRAIAP